MPRQMIISKLTSEAAVQNSLQKLQFLALQIPLKITFFRISAFLDTEEIRQGTSEKVASPHQVVTTI